MSTTQWLLALHVLGAALFVGGAVAAGVLQIAALGRRRPSEVAQLLSLTRVGVALVGVGSLVALVLGIWLAHRTGYGVGRSWVVASIVLWVVAMALGGAGGRTARHARELAERLAREGDEPSAELESLVAHRPSLLLSYLSTAAVLAILGLMVWKP